MYRILIEHIAKMLFNLGTLQEIKICLYSPVLFWLDAECIFYFE